MRSPLRQRGRVGGRWTKLWWGCAVVALAGMTAWAVLSPANPASSAQDHHHQAPPAAAQPRPNTGSSNASALLVNRCPADAVACVDTRLRLAWLQHRGTVTYGPVPIMPGTPGPHDAAATPDGTFHVQWKNAHQVSSEYNEAMPNAVFFAPGGIAFHQGSLISGSHGCVHLSQAASRYFYDHLRRGDEVAVFGT